MATLRDVAERAGVTVTTVSRMLNGRVNVSGKTRDKIEKAMRELGYHPNEMARSLAKKSSNIIGLMVPSAKQYFFAELIQEVEDAVAANNSWRATARALTGSRIPAPRSSISKESPQTAPPAP